ncbi:MAG: hypothetical protein HWD59_13235 [Coxiellaceae bacterium]|nr:MAG: hypothetical protein HWD59_13235 [Coxiellaceae bacterium]
MFTYRHTCVLLLSLFSSVCFAAKSCIPGVVSLTLNNVSKTANVTFKAWDGFSRIPLAGHWGPAPNGPLPPGAQGKAIYQWTVYDCGKYPGAGFGRGFTTRENSGHVLVKVTPGKAETPVILDYTNAKCQTSIGSNNTQITNLYGQPQIQGSIIVNIDCDRG